GYIARLTGQPLHSLLPEDAPATSAGPDAADAGADAAGAAPDAAGADADISAPGAAAPGPADVPAPAPGSPAPAGTGWPAGPGSSVTRPMPAASSLGSSYAPGEAS